MTRVLSHAPTRIDLAGGTLDIWPLHRLFPVATTVNVAVDLRAGVDISESTDGVFHVVSRDQNTRWDGSWDQLVGANELALATRCLREWWDESLPALHVTTEARSPAGAGLGGSSTLAIALLGALRAARRHWGMALPDVVQEDRRLVDTAQDIEASVIRVPTGCQDYWAAVRGGMNVIEMMAGGERVTTLPIARSGALADELTLVWTGAPRASAMNNWEVFQRAFAGDKSILVALGEIATEAAACAAASIEGDYERATRHSSREWEARRRLWPGIETDATRRVMTVAKTAGARLCRVCGAGGGGCVAVLSDPGCRERTREALVAAGEQVLACQLTHQGLVVTVEPS